MAKRRRRFTREFKLAALTKLEQCSSVTALASELGICREMLHKWRVSHEEGGAEALRSIGRPEGSAGPGRSANPSDPAAERIAELERLVGQQPADLVFSRSLAAARGQMPEQRRHWRDDVFAVI